jgi:tRNA nucleotidyltransferase/poly(A) polymerase
MRRLSSFVMPAKPRLVFTGTVTPTIEEQEVFDQLLEGKNAHEATRPVELRVVGGWVRDKLLSQSPGDIDVCLSHMTGQQFATEVGEAFSLVSVNPEQSKHLETAIVRIAERDVDLTHMRSEEYSPDSRIPRVVFGTPLQDALRRDCTVNALYYNLESREVEDPTGRGLRDLQEGLICTPAPALDTLCDDPLRLLRLIRFGAALGFRLDDKLVEAFSDERVLEGLRRKISRERIRVEFGKMMLLHAEGCAAAMHSIEQVKDLIEIVLWKLQHGALPPSLVQAVSLPPPAVEAIDSMKTLHAARLAALLLNASPSELKEQAEARLKWSNELTRTVLSLVRGSQVLRSMPADPQPRQVGLWARERGVHMWELTLALTAASVNDWSRFDSILQQLKSGPLAERAFMPPVLRGHEVARARALQGASIGAALADLVEWQMNAPSLTQEAALEHLARRLY